MKKLCGRKSAAATIVSSYSVLSNARLYVFVLLEFDGGSIPALHFRSGLTLKKAHDQKCPFHK